MSQQQALLIIQSGKQNSRYFADMWRFRELFLFLTWKDILVRYKQTVIGVLWSVLRPLLTMLAFTLVFGKFGNMPTEGQAPYALLVFAALLPWQLFSNAISESSSSLISNADLISKIYFPRIILPISAIMTALVDFSIAFVLYIIMMLLYGITPGWQVIIIPLFTAMALLAAIGGGLIISALNVKYRDFRYIVPFIVQFGLYVSPVGFSSRVVPEKWRLLYAVNPMVGVIDGFRWCLLGESVTFYWPGFMMSLAVTAVLLIIGYKLFRSMEATFADTI